LKQKQIRYRNIMVKMVKTIIRPAKQILPTS